MKPHYHYNWRARTVEKSWFKTWAEKRRFLVTWKVLLAVKV